MNKWLFRLYVVLILIALMMVTAWRTFAPVMLPMGLALLFLCGLLIFWEGTPRGKIQGYKHRRKER